MSNAPTVLAESLSNRGDQDSPFVRRFVRGNIHVVLRFRQETIFKMKERPILFSSPMVKAILEGRKTQTRRIMKPQIEQREHGWYWRCGRRLLEASYGADYVHTDLKSAVRIAEDHSPHGTPGERLWVKETFYPMPDLNAKAYYRATDPLVGVIRWKSSIFMPRKLSRITLEITTVRVERLQDISHKDALEEGVEYDVSKSDGCPCERYRKLWESINGKGSWKKNPWVWVIEFKKV